MTFRPVISNQIVVTTIVVLLVLLAMGVFFLVLSHQYRDRGSVHYVFIFSGCLMLLFMVGSYNFRIRSYEINAGDLVVNTGFGKKVLPLSGLQEARLEESPFVGARKEGGMGGVWSVFGRFSNPKWGRFNAYATDMARGVLLVWPDKKVFVTPDDTASFIQSAKAAR